MVAARKPFNCSHRSQKAVETSRDHMYVLARQIQASRAAEEASSSHAMNAFCASSSFSSAATVSKMAEVQSNVDSRLNASDSASVELQDHREWTGTRPNESAEPATLIPPFPSGASPPGTGSISQVYMRTRVWVFLKENFIAVTSLIAFFVTIAFGAGAWSGMNYANGYAQKSYELALFSACHEYEVR
jgi:hypothetical protein